MIPGSLPKGWAKVRLGEILPLSYGKSLPERVRASDGDVAVIGSSGKVGKHNQALVDVACIVVGRKGSAGSVYLIDGPSWPIDTAYYCISPDGLDLRWSYYRLQALHLGHLDQSTAIPSLGRDEYSRQEIALPPTSEQRRIVAKIDNLFTRLDAAEAGLKQTQKLLKSCRETAVISAYRGDLTRHLRNNAAGNIISAKEILFKLKNALEKATEGQRRQNNSLKSRLDNIEWKPTFTLPASWLWTSLGEIADIVGGITKNSKRKVDKAVVVPYLRVANVQRGFLNLSKISSITASRSEITELALRAGDILLNEGGDLDKLGRGWVWEGQIDPCIHQNHVFRARLFLGDVPPTFISRYINEFCQNFFMKEGSQTTNLASVSLSKVRQIPIPIPPLEEMIEIDRRCHEIFNQIDDIENRVAQNISALAPVRQSILASAFRGEFTTQNPNDEPAAGLLKQILAKRINKDATSKHEFSRTKGAVQ